jgi:VanZ family protein
MVATRLTIWAPVIVWAGLIFTLSSIPSLDRGLGTRELGPRNLVHFVEYAILGALLLRALRREPLAVFLGSAYAATDEVHQEFFVTGRQGSPLDWTIDTAGVVLGALLFAAEELAARRRAYDTARADLAERQNSLFNAVVSLRAIAIDLDGALVDTRPLWRDFLREAARRFGSIAPLDPEALPDDRGAAALELDRWAAAGVGNWRAALERFAEVRAPVYLRPSGEASAALRALQAAGCRLGVFTDAPEELARVALAHLGAARRVELVEAGAGARERLLERLGPGSSIVSTHEELTNSLR